MTDDPWLRRPPCDTGGNEERFRRLVETWSGDACATVDPRTLGVPAWAFLAWLGEQRGLLLHGSNDPDLEVCEPQVPDDRSPDPFSRRRAVYASSDAVWATFYAVLDRSVPGLRFLNAALRFEEDDGRLGEPRYYFSVAEAAAAAGCWRPGTVYVLRRDGFERRAPFTVGGRRAVEPHYASPRPVRPIARLAVAPDDFPLLGAVRVHDPDEVDARAERDPEGFPWLHEGEGADGGGTGGG